MAERLTIAERIERRFRTRLKEIEGIQDAHRADYRGLDLRPFHAYLFNNGEDAEEGGMGNDGTTSAKLNLHVGVVIALSGKEPDVPAQIVNRWRGLIHEKIMADADVTDDDANAQPLSNDAGGAEYLGYQSVAILEDQTEIWIELGFRVPYQFYRSNPYAGPAITERIE